MIDKIKKAIEGSERLKIIYHGGSSPGTMREIIPRSIRDNKLIAYCLASDLDKNFFLDKIQIIEEYAQGDDKNDDLTVIASFGKCMEEDDSFLVFKDVKKLPYPREVILKSLCRQISITKNDKHCEQMKVGLLFLASYQEDVGDENLYMSGFDKQQLIKESAKEYTPEQLRELSAEETSKFMKKFTEKFTDNSEAIEHQKKKYEHFKKLCEKDQEEFYNLIGCSWPPTLT
jgi:hypothetical protein